MSQKGNANEKEKIAQDQRWDLPECQKWTVQEEKDVKKTGATAKEVGVKPGKLDIRGHFFLMYLRRKLNLHHWMGKLLDYLYTQ